METRGRPRRGKKDEAAGRLPTQGQIDALTAELEASGETVKGDFQTWLRQRAERELWFFSRWILGNDHLSLGTFHRREVCTFLSDFRSSRFKLLMLPMGHLKTTVASRSLPLHVLIQPIARNIYYPGMSGREARILLANENELKCKENLDVLKRHLEDNVWLRWLWPDVVWDNPKKESPRWSDFQLEVKRAGIYAEASIAAVGIKTGFIGRYYDMILPDDICGLEASQNPQLMERVKKWRRTAKTRFYTKEGVRSGIFCGVGTHWGSDDVYGEWKKDPAVEVMIRSIEEPDAYGNLQPLWPEKFPAPLIKQIREGMDPIEWALWYLNKPVPAGYTALNWDDLREFRMSPDGRMLQFAESVLDERIAKRYEVKAKNLGFRLGNTPYNPMEAKIRTKPAAGMDKEYFDYMREKYKERVQQ